MENEKVKKYNTIQYMPVLYNYEYYKDKLDSIPYKRFYDMVAVVKKLRVGPCLERLYSDVTFEDLEKLGKDEDEIFADSLVSCINEESFRLFRIADFLEAMDMDDVPAPDDLFEAPNIYCLTNMSLEYGANVLLYPGIFEKIYQILNDSYYILPANIDQLIVVTDAELPYDVANYYMAMEEVNEVILDESQILSHTVFYYDGSLHNLSFVN
ncbi:MAG: DUF5688 family protein [Eubacterium sp.]|nr:DUF5688 family protein [Eubacterium sp.]